ncbi:MAG: DUF3313 domain-containing protein [Steroidobacteraceae bacterium]
MRRLCIIICCGVFMLVACSSQTPKTTGGLGDKLPLAPGQYPGTLVYRSPTLDTSSGKYKALFVDDADIYHAADADFGSASQADKERLAAKLTSEFRSALTKHKYPLVSQPGQGVVRIHLTLSGLKESKPVAATVLRLTPLGLGMSAANTVAGHSSALVGSVTVAGEITDTQTKEALAGFVATESPIALDISSGLGTLRAAELGIERGAEEFATDLDRTLNRSPK